MYMTLFFTGKDKARKKVLGGWRHTTVFAKSVENMLLRPPVKCNEIDAAGRVSGYKWRQNFAS